MRKSQAKYRQNYWKHWGRSIFFGSSIKEGFSPLCGTDTTNYFICTLIFSNTYISYPFKTQGTDGQDPLGGKSEREKESRKAGPTLRRPIRDVRASHPDARKEWEMQQKAGSAKQQSPSNR